MHKNRPYFFIKQYEFHQYRIQHVKYTVLVDAVSHTEAQSSLDYNDCNVSIVDTDYYDSETFDTEYIGEIDGFED